MYLTDPVNRVFATNEVLERILEYTAAQQPYSEARGLRLVGKGWRECSYRGLCQSKQLPKVAVQNHWFYIKSPDVTTRNDFRKRFITTCPPELNLTPPQLPISLEVNGLITRDDFDFMQISPIVACIEVKMFASYDAVNCENKQDESQFSQLNLINLRKLYVQWAPVTSPINKQLEKFVRHVAGCSKRLSVVKSTYPNDAFRDCVPRSLTNSTHIEVTGTINHLREVIDTTGYEIRTIKFNLKYGIREFKEEADCEILTKLIERCSCNLEELQITNKFGKQVTGELQLPLLKSLKMLQIEIPFSFKAEC